MSDNEQGLYGKYILSKKSGNPIDPNARYFVLRYDEDPHARVALKAYAESCEKDNPLLSNDLMYELLHLEADEANS